MTFERVRVTYQSAQNLNVMGSLAGFFVTSAGSGVADMTVCVDVGGDGIDVRYIAGGRAERLLSTVDFCEVSVVKRGRSERRVF